MTRERTVVLVALVLFSLCARAPGGDGAAAPKVPDTVPAAADEVARLAAVPDPAGIARLASALQTDPWYVADELCARGAFDVADVLAHALPPTRRGGLIALIAEERRAPTDPARRAAHKAAVAAREARKPAEGVRIVDAAGEPRADVVSVRLLTERAYDVEDLGDRRGALDAHLALVERARAMDWPTREADFIKYAASQAQQIGDLELGARLWDRAAGIYRGFPAPVDEGAALQKVAKVRFDQGRRGEALATMRRALPLIQQGGEGAVLGRAFGALAVYEDEAGDLANAMAHHEDALRLLGRSPTATERVLAAMNASRTAYRLNDVAGAIAFADRALSDPAFAAAAPGARPDPNLTSIRGRVLLHRATYRTASRDLDGALTDVEESARAFAQAGDRPRLARAAGERGDALAKRGDLDGAAKSYEESLAIAEALGDRSLLGRIRLSVGDLAMRRGAADDAIKSWEAAIVDARETGATRVESYCLGRVAEALLAKGDAREALVDARAAVALESREARALGADEGATLAAGRSSSEIGLAAAARLGDVAAWFEISESGRASALAESVGGRSAIQATAVSETLTAEAAAAAADLAHATDETTKARASGDLAALRAATANETAAKERVRVAQDRIERGRKLSARLDAPTPPALDDVRRRIGKARALVVFHVGPETTEALVLTEDATRLVDLGATAALVATCDAVRSGDATAEQVAAAKSAIVDALGLAKEIRTLLVVPEGPLASTPFGLLDPDRDTAIVPSALVWTLLDAERGERGAGVLAVGDPDYAGTKLVSLPATRAEATGVGTRVLLGRDATEEAVRRALVESPRWHAVHFACHGVVDPRHASLCGLALTRAAPDDGMFTAREIIGLPVPADVVVLSACEAGRPGTPTSAATSAATGLPPAFLAAGCARVVANLWKIDDEAGRVFSVAFHRAWAKEGVSAAQALRAARDAVRADPRFAAPRRWAGWVLWGLPD